jgi:malic enzyme
VFVLELTIIGDITKQRVVVAGAGAAGLGVVGALANAMKKEGADEITAVCC